MSDQPEKPRNDMAWPRPPDEETPEEKLEPTAPTPSAAQRQIQELLEQRQPHVMPIRVEEPKPIESLSDDEDEEFLEEEPQAIYKGPHIETPEFDPIFGLMVITAVGIGLLPLDANVRYVVLWILLGGLGLAGYIVGNSARLSDTSPDDMRIGIGLGIVIGLPMMILVGQALAKISERMFDVSQVPYEIMDTWVLMAVGFVIPAVETLYFRGVLQQVHNLALTALVATGWSMLLFYPHMSLGNAPSIAVSMGLFFGLLNFLYGYVRHRNGLAAAWSCQIVAGTLIWFLPRLLF